MKVYVDDREMSIFEGARVCDALRRYEVETGKRIGCCMRVKDRYGNKLADDTPLRDGVRIYLER